MACGYIDRKGVSHQREDCKHAKKVASEQGYTYYNNPLPRIVKPKNPGATPSNPGSMVFPKDFPGNNPTYTDVAPAENPVSGFLPIIIFLLVPLLLLRR